MQPATTYYWVNNTTARADHDALLSGVRKGRVMSEETRDVLCIGGGGVGSARLQNENSDRFIGEIEDFD